VCKPRYEVWKRKRQAELDIPIGGNYNNNSRHANTGHGKTNDRGGRGRGGGRDAHGGRGTGGTGYGGNGSGYGGNTNGNAIASGKGVFIKTDPHKPFIFDERCIIPTFRQQGQDRDLCLRFATRNSGGCLWGARCNKFHLTELTYNDLPKAKQQEVATLVAKTKNLEFATGFAPDKGGGRTTTPTGNASKKAKRAPDEAKESDNGNAKPAKAVVFAAPDSNEG
jgi:hypothetical protein